MPERDQSSVVIASGMVFVGAVVIGKFVIDQIVFERSMTKAGQKEEHPKSKPTALDEVVKVCAAAYSVYTMYQEIPDLWKELQSYVP